MTTITRAETTYVEQGWRWGGGGRVFSFDMMIEMPDSPKVAALMSNSEVLFEEKRYVVNLTQIVRKSPKTVRLALSRIDAASETSRQENQKHRSTIPSSQPGTSPIVSPPIAA